MGYIALYRKYRPSNFDDVYGQKEIVTILKNAILANKLSHAYLFCGPRGTGKTTIAKIVAKMVNCTNLQEDGNSCGKCQNCLSQNNNDIIEIDAASNNGIDEIRELRDKINLVPSNSKYKVYIIDEVHMLTIQAFNALLKTLEEPPSHAIFILATTEPHKVPLTIASRCQKFKFTKIDTSEIVKRLKNISVNESIEISDDCLYEIARLSDGGMRDAINLLDQLIAFGNSKISLEDVYKVSGSISYNEINNLIEYILSNNKVSIINFIDELDKDGKDINKFIDETISYLKDIILYKNGNYLSDIENKNNCIKNISSTLSNDILYSFIDELSSSQNKIKLSNHGTIILLTTLLKISDIFTNGNTINYQIVEKNISQEIKLKKNINLKDKNKIELDIENRINNAFVLASKEKLKEFQNKWNNIENYLLDEKYAIVSGLLRDSKVVVGSDKYIIISSNLDSTVDRINQNIENVQRFLNIILDYNVLAVAISNTRWNSEKLKYIENIKNGFSYELKELNENNIEKNVAERPVDKLIDLMGSSVIEYR